MCWWGMGCASEAGYTACMQGGAEPSRQSLATGAEHKLMWKCYQESLEHFYSVSWLTREAWLGKKGGAETF